MWQTDGRQTVTLRFLPDAASVLNGACFDVIPVAEPTSSKHSRERTAFDFSPRKLSTAASRSWSTDKFTLQLTREETGRRQ